MNTNTFFLFLLILGVFIKYFSSSNKLTSSLCLNSFMDLGSFILCSSCRSVLAGRA